MTWPEGGKRLPLWDAIYNGDIVVAQKLLVTKDGAAQVNVPYGQTSVHVAVQHGHAKLLKHLLFTGADVNARTINGTTPLHLAVEINRRDIVQDLLLAGANPLLRNFTGQTVLQSAVCRGLTPIATLLRQGIDSQRTLATLEGASQQTAQRRQPAL
ncbi:hypothetical protein PHMEG_00022538 [Phytophthora megakarya]|uniref:Uncharacterized protein n=1 Tax=Phytophthora megakarya TaxID=4795 RepID=A0A225VK40_9STRA|nr:hypothetical protein PHMEG_00022538 [Phytophthora megakarya]